MIQLAAEKHTEVKRLAPFASPVFCYTFPGILRCAQDANAEVARIAAQLNEMREREAKAAVQIAALQCEKAALLRELYLQSTGVPAGEGLREQAAREVKQEVGERVGWNFGRS